MVRSDRCANFILSLAFLAGTTEHLCSVPIPPTPPAPSREDLRGIDVVINSSPASHRFRVYEAVRAPNQQRDSRDTYGSQLWPAAVHLASYLMSSKESIKGLKVLELGCGSGLVSLAAARLGAQVLATDYRQLPLDLLRTAHMENDPLGSEQLRCAVLDLAVPMPTALQVSTVHRKDMDRVAREVTLHVRDRLPPPEKPLPPHDVLLAADVGYSKALAWRLGERCRETLAAGGRVVICESRQMPECRLAFREALNLKQTSQLRLEKRPALMLGLCFLVHRADHPAWSEKIEVCPFPPRACPMFGSWTPAETGDLKGRGRAELRRGGALRGKKGLRLRFVRGPSPFGSYLEALLQLDSLLADLAREAARPLPAKRFAFAGIALPGWVCPEEGLSPSRHVNRPRPAKGWAGWVCPECHYINEKGQDFCANYPRTAWATTRGFGIPIGTAWGPWPEHISTGRGQRAFALAQGPGPASSLRRLPLTRTRTRAANSRLPVGPLELPLLGLVVEKDVDETSFVRALQLGVRAFYLSASASALGFSDALLRSGVERRAVLVLGERPSEVLLEADLEELRDLDGVALRVSNEEDLDRRAWTRLEEHLSKEHLRLSHGLSLRMGVELFHMEMEVKPSFVLQRFSIYEPGGPDEARKWTSQMETLQSLGIVTMARGLTEEWSQRPENRSYGYLNPLEDPHIAAMAKGTDRSARQVIDRCLAASSPGRRAPVWCEDVYHLSELPLET
eukprot:g29465.t1